MKIAEFVHYPTSLCEQENENADLLLVGLTFDV